MFLRKKGDGRLRHKANSTNKTPKNSSQVDCQVISRVPTGTKDYWSMLSLPIGRLKSDDRNCSKVNRKVAWNWAVELSYGKTKRTRKRKIKIEQQKNGIKKDNQNDLANVSSPAVFFFILMMLVFVWLSAIEMADWPWCGHLFNSKNTTTNLKNYCSMTSPFPTSSNR